MPLNTPQEAPPDSPFGDESLQRRNALKAMLLFTLPGAGLILAINLHLAFVVLVLLRRGVSVTGLGIAYLLLLFVNILAGVAWPDLHPGTTTWMALMPVLAYLLLDASVALPLALIGIVGAGGAYFAGAGVAPQRLEFLRLVHAFMPVLALLTVSHFYARGRSRSLREMLERISQDVLTGLWNREKLIREIELEGKRRQRTGSRLSLILLDLDNFKALNDQWGHDAGDAALVFVARLLEGRLRETDLACRIGGEEFAVLLPETSLEGAMRVAEELRQSLEASVVDYRGERFNLTLSAGVVEMGRDGNDWLQLYRAADALLYKCKDLGRNCVLGSTSWREVRGRFRDPEQG